MGKKLHLLWESETAQEIYEMIDGRPFVTGKVVVLLLKFYATLAFLAAPNQTQLDSLLPY